MATNFPENNPALKVPDLDIFPLRLDIAVSAITQSSLPEYKYWLHLAGGRELTLELALPCSHATAKSASS